MSGSETDREKAAADGAGGSNSGMAAGKSRRRILIALLIGLLAVVGVVIVLAAWRPAFYAPMAATVSVPMREQAAGRLVTQVSAIYGGLGRPGRWEAAIADEEVNAWLDLDLPRNHPTLLPSGVRQPHVAFEPKRIKAGVKIGYGIASVVAWVDAEVVLRDINQLSVAIDDARIGLVPVPRGLVLHAIARRLAPLGVVPELRRIDDRLVLVLYIPSIHGSGMTCRLEGLRIDEGEAVMEGVTRKADAP